MANKIYTKKKVFIWILVLVMTVLIFVWGGQVSYAASGTIGEVVVTNISDQELTLSKGSSYQIKTKVKRSGKISGKVGYLSSNNKIAAVDKNGKITAKKKGTVVVTVYAKADRKKSCSVKVTVGTMAVTVKSARSVQIRFAKAYKLKKQDVKVYRRKTESGKRKKCKVIDLVKRDKKTYVLMLDADSELSDGNYAEVVVPKKAAVMNRYKAIPDRLMSRVIWNTEKGEKITGEEYRCTLSGTGNSKVSVKGLPAGIRSKKVNKSGEQYVQFYGIPEKTGKVVTTVISVDDQGGTYTDQITWVIYDKNKIRAAADDVDILLRPGVSQEFSSQIHVYGGSGSYQYRLTGKKYGCRIDPDGELTGSVRKAGTYTINVQVTDRKDPKITCTTKLLIHAEEGNYIQGTVRCISGSPIPNAKIIFVKRNRVDDQSRWVEYDTNADGSYEVLLADGTYDIFVSKSGWQKDYYAKKITKSQEAYDFRLPLYRVRIKSDVSVVKAENFDNWTDAKGKVYGVGAELYLPAGTFDLYTKPVFENSGIRYRASVHVTVKDRNIKKNAKVILENQCKKEGKTYIYLKGNDQKQYFYFVPETTGTYTIRVDAGSENWTDQTVYVNLYNSKNIGITDGRRNGQEQYSGLTETLEGGKTYYIVIESSSSTKTECIFSVTKN